MKHRPFFRLNAAGAALKAKGKRVPTTAPAFGTWVHVYMDAVVRDGEAEWEKVRRACERECREHGDALLHNAELARTALDIRDGRVARPLTLVVTWDDVWASFLAVRAKAPALPALQSMGRLWFAPVLSGKQARAITPALCLEVLTRAEEEGLAASTRKLLFSTLRSVFAHAVNVMECLERNPMRRLKAPRVPKVKRPALSVEQALQLVEGAGPHRLLFLFTVSTGLRRAEVGGLRWTDIRWAEGAHGVVYAARSWDRETTKGKEERPIPLHPVVRQALAEARQWATSELVFPSPATGRMRSTTWHAADLLRNVARRAGVELPAGLTFHGLRRTFATLLHQATNDLKTTQRLLGHQDSRTTDGYLAHQLPHLERAMAQMPLFPAAAPPEATPATPPETTPEAPHHLAKAG